jgi:exosortase
MYFRVVSDMVSVWLHDDNYSHGFLVPIIAAILFWQRWPELQKRTVQPEIFGLLVLVLGVIQLLTAEIAFEYFTMRSSLIVIIAGLILFIFGREILKGMTLPLSYLLLMIPIPYIIYDMIAFPLKLFVTKISVTILKLAGVVVLREGNIIMFPATTLEVADACSGIRSLVSLIAIAAAYVFLTQISPVGRWIVILTAVPIAVATNVVRVVTTGVLAQWWGAKAAEGFFHEFAGAAMFVCALLLLLTLGELIRRYEVPQDD